MKTLFPVGLLCAAAVVMTACGGSDSTPSSANDAPATKSASGLVGGTSETPTFGGDVIEIVGSITRDGSAGDMSDVQPGDNITANVVTSLAKVDGVIQLSDVDVIHEIQGTISTLDVAASSMVVLGQTVRVDALTELVTENSDDSYSSLVLADFQVGDYVEVSGSRDANGDVVASRIERKTADSQRDDADSEVRGWVSALDATTQTFLIGDLLVDFSGAEVQGLLADGAPVKVEGTLLGSTLAASEVKVGDDRHRRVEEQYELEIHGVVGALDTTAQTFETAGTLVNYAGLSVPGLENGARVEVEGTVTSTEPPALRATKVEVEYERVGPGSSNGEVKGPMTAINGAEMTFQIGEVLLYADAMTVFEREDRRAAFADFSENEFVEVKYDSTQPNVAGAFYALKVESELRGISDDDHDTNDRDNGDNGDDADTGDREGVEVKGAVAAFDPAAQTFSVSGVAVQISEATRFEVDDQAISADEFFAQDRTGVRVEVKGDLQGGVLIADRVEVESSDD